MELTTKQIERQDFVDNSIFNLIQELNPSNMDIDWDIEIIGEIRDVIKGYFMDLTICTEDVFYPRIDE